MSHLPCPSAVLGSARPQRFRFPVGLHDHFQPHARRALHVRVGLWRERQRQWQLRQDARSQRDGR